MANSKALYFVALLPPQKLQEEIRQLKLEIKAKTGVSHALKLPAHITLLPPFWLKDQLENDLLTALEAVTSNFIKFDIELKGFGRFDQRVIFIKLKDHEAVKRLHQQLQQSVSGIFEELKKKESLHPHITLATRDLTKAYFLELWPGFQKRDFSGTFSAEGVTLFKHNGKRWEILRQFRG